MSKTFTNVQQVVRRNRYIPGGAFARVEKDHGF